MRHAAIRRAALVCWAASVFLLLILVLIASIILPADYVLHYHQEEVMATQPMQGITETEYVQLPAEISCTDLSIKAIASFDGPFYEDGSGEEVINVASLLLYNRSDRVIPYACVIVDTEETRYSFRAYMIPPKATVLVPEASAQTYCKSEIVKIFGWQTVDKPEKPVQVQITELADTFMRIENLSGEEVQDLTVYFRTYIQQGDVYLGGKPYRAEIPSIPAGQTVIISPKYYVCGYSRIIYYE